METLLSKGLERGLSHRIIAHRTAKCHRKASTGGAFKIYPAPGSYCGQNESAFGMRPDFGAIQLSFLSESNVQQGPRWSCNCQVTEERCKEGLGLKSEDS